MKRNSAAKERTARPNSNEFVAGLIREAILEGRLLPGTRLKEVDLAKQFGSSRTPVREALLMLSVQGLIVSEPNRGATVRGYTTSELDDLYWVRSVLEGLAARFAAARISRAGLAELRASCLRFAGLPTEDVEGLVRENMRFHNVVLEEAGSPLLAELARKTIELPLVFRSFHWYSPTQKQLSVSYHEQLADVLEEGDAELAELIMRAHVLAARTELARHSELAAPQPSGDGA